MQQALDLQFPNRKILEVSEDEKHNSVTLRDSKLPVFKFWQLWNSNSGLLHEPLNPILHGGGRIFPPGRLSLSNRRWMLQMGWFFMTLFLPILERSWRGHVWKLFWKFQKFLRRQFFQNSIQRGTILCKIQKVEKFKFFFVPNPIFSAWIWIINVLNFQLRYQTCLTTSF